MPQNSPDAESCNKVNLHFIPNTHLDREWTMDFQHTRALTVDFLDNLLKIMAQVPDYRFLLDAQTVPLEDYLEIRPENKGIIKRHIREGRLNVGPWYTALDMNCICGETVVRNLLVGHLSVKDFGPVMKVGYTPFGWGQPSQLPQIYRGFGIDVVLFYRGVTGKNTGGKTEFKWRGADGSEVLCSRCARYNFYFGVWRPAFFADQPKRLERSCDWFEKDTIFKLCPEDERQGHGTLLDPKRSLDKTKLESHLRNQIDTDKNIFSTSEIAFMHGMDTSYPDIREDVVMKEGQKYLKPGEAFFYSSLDRYAQDLKAALNGVSLARVDGEARYLDAQANVHNDIISSRPRQKMLTSKAEASLCRLAEPLAAVAHTLGNEWPKQYLSLAWKQLLKCLPHDTIGGCSIDRVEEDAQYRLQDSISLSSVVMMEAAAGIQNAIDTSKLDKDSLVLTVFNSAPFERSETIEAFVEIPPDWTGKDLAIFDADGKPVSFTSKATGHVGQIFRDKTDLALATLSREHKIVFHAENIPALGYRCFVIKAATHQDNSPNVSPSPGRLENDFLTVNVNANGTIDVRNKHTGREFHGLHFFEDCGEAGNAWTYTSVPGDTPITSLTQNASISCIENSPVRAAYRVSFRMTIPKETVLDEPWGYMPKTERTKETVELPITVVYALSKHSDAVEVTTTVDNTARGHRLRACFPTNLQSDASFAESAFDVVYRRIPLDDKNPYRECPKHTYPFLRFAGINDDRDCFAFVSNGIREYEMLDDAQRTMAVTLVRAFINRICTTWMMEHRREPGSQSLGLHVFQYRLSFTVPDNSFSRLFRQADEISTPLMPALAGKKEGTLPLAQSFFEIRGKGIEMSCLKAAEDGKGFVFRLFNPTDTTRQGTLVSAHPIASAQTLTLEELKAGDAPLVRRRNEIDVSLSPKKILTIRVAFK